MSIRFAVGRSAPLKSVMHLVMSNLVAAPAADAPHDTTEQQPRSADQLIRENRSIPKESLAAEVNDSRERAQVIIDNGLGTEFCANNARPRTSAQTKEALLRLNIECVDHAVYSPDLALSDYHPFGRLKEHLRGCRFTCDDKLKRTVKRWLTSQLAHFYSARPAKLPGRWQTCINRGSDYAE